MDTGVLDFFNRKLILDDYFCLMSGPAFLFQMFIIAPSVKEIYLIFIHLFDSGILFIIEKREKGR
jgi:hypothetical protein